MKTSKDCIDACLAALIACESCITDCVKVVNQDIIPICRDCADICELCARFEARGSKYEKDLLLLCAKICKACEIECKKHCYHHLSCKECAEACNLCAEICEELANDK